jgi:choloylglycine hydrolase
MLKKSQILLSALIFAASLAQQTANACTMAFWNNNEVAKVAGRTMDLYISDEPQMVVYPRGTEHEGMVGENSLHWKSKYGNVVITAFHTPAASEGLNEMGFGAHLLYLNDSQYEKRDTSKPGLSNVMWAQYLLDNCKTVDEALTEVKNFQVVATKVHGREWPIHIAFEDASGDSAIIEFIKGKMVVHHGKQYQVMTNEPAYDIQLANLKKYKFFGGKLAMPGDVDPLSRFVRAASYLKTLPAPKNCMDAMAGIASVMRTTMVPFGAEDTSGSVAEDSWATRWMSVQDLSNKIYYFNSTQAPNMIWLDFKKLNFAQGAPVMRVDLTDLQQVGDVSKNLVIDK